MPPKDKKTVARARKPTAEKRKYAEDVKCSVDVGAKTRNRAADDGAATGRPTTALTAKFQKGGSANSQKTSGDRDKTIIKSVTEMPKDPRTRACSHWMSETLATGLRGIRKEFVSSVKPYQPAGPCEVCIEHSAYNRYEDVHCLDKTRVKLANNPEGEDYIHASFVTVHPEMTYICAQGPMSNTVSHFWLMVIQEGAKVVLQLCQLKEDGKEKCNEYYPPAAEGPDWKTYGFVQVRVMDRNNNVGGMKKVTKSKMQVKLDEKDAKVHELTHIYYYGWPDHSVAESVATCKEVRNLVHRNYEKKPIVAHCSAGIGRTGTFAMIELVSYRLLIKHDVDFKMVDVAHELREQRKHAIQNDQQYVFVYRCVLEVLLGEDALPKSSDVAKFIEDYDSLISRKKAERAKTKNKTM
uniref:Protein-tyrosine phosphatase n=1 Tax=Panagrellus redivivus TaxID=6233 RepID=A0A7E4V2V4_PANRE